jgi:hypothetical protein
MAWWNEPLVPEAPVRRAQEAIDTPTVGRQPWEARLKGFGAGALEGLRGLTSPIELAGIAGLGLGGGAALRGAGEAAEMAPAVASRMSELIQGGQQARTAARMAELIKNAPKAIQGLSDLSVVEPAAEVGQVAPSAGEVTDILSSLQGRLGQLPQARFPRGLPGRVR